MKELSGIINIQRGWKYYQGFIHNTYHGGNIETYRHVIFLMPEDISNHIVFHKFTPPVSSTLREILDNDTTTRDKISLKVLGMAKVESGGVFMMMKTVMKVAQGYTIF